MKVETFHGDVLLIEERDGCYVKSGESWVWPVFSTVCYPKEKPEPLPREVALEVIRRAVSDSEMVHEAVHGK